MLRTKSLSVGLVALFLVLLLHSVSINTEERNKKEICTSLTKLRPGDALLLSSFVFVVHMVNQEEEQK